MHQVCLIERKKEQLIVNKQVGTKREQRIMLGKYDKSNLYSYNKQINGKYWKKQKTKQIAL